MGAFFPLHIFKTNDESHVFVFVAFEIGRRRLFPTANRPKTLTIIEIRILIVVLPWIRPQEPFFPISYFAKTCKINKHIRFVFKSFTSIKILSDFMKV